MSRSREYQQILNSKAWQQLRISYLRAHPYCERCLAEGRYVSPVDVHHRTPVESKAKEGIAAMRQVALDPDNLEALCVPCHVVRHKEMGRGTKQLHQEREADRSRQWLERIRARQAKGSDTCM
jgi:5-methylcytosine-specific restriction endonuclease McrA